MRLPSIDLQNDKNKSTKQNVSKGRKFHGYIGGVKDLIASTDWFLFLSYYYYTKSGDGPKKKGTYFWQKDVNDILSIF